MGYLELPRLHFSGTFRAAPSTINNTDSNYDTSINPPNPLLWNPTGRAEFQILSGTEKFLQPGATVVPTKIASAETSKGLITSGDPVGLFVISTNKPTAGKLVDLDPDQQFVSQVWGMQIAIGTPGGEQVIGDYTAAYFQQIFWQRNSAGAPSAAYQSLLTNLQWPSKITSKFLQALQKASPDLLSIRFTLDQIDLSSRLSNGQPNPNFTLGRVTGAIGPAAAGDPTFLNPRGRMLRPVPLSAQTVTTAALDAARQSAAAIAEFKAEPNAPPPQPFTAFNFAPAIFDTSRNTVVIDLANTLQFNGNDPVPGGALSAAIVTPKKTIPLGTIDNSLDNYLQRAWIFEFPVKSSDDCTAAAANPIVVQLDGTTVLSENTNGTYVDATDHVVRMQPNSPTPTTLSLFATTFGGPVGSGQQVTLGPAAPFNTNDPQVDIITFTPNPVPLDPSGSATFTITAGNPDNPRGPIDGQVYAAPITWSEDTNPDVNNAFLSILVFDELANDEPTWKNVQPIFNQFMHLYPGMKSILDLTDQKKVKANAAKIAGVLSEPITSPHYMPVTRDLSEAKKQMILAYLKSVQT